MKERKRHIPITRRLHKVWFAVYEWALSDAKANQRAARSIADTVIYELEITQSTYESLRSIRRRRKKSPT